MTDDYLYMHTVELHERCVDMLHELEMRHIDTTQFGEWSTGYQVGKAYEKDLRARHDSMISSLHKLIKTLKASGGEYFNPGYLDAEEIGQMITEILNTEKVEKAANEDHR